MPTSFWVDAVYTSVYTVNRLPTPVLGNVSPFQKLFGRVPDYSFYDLLAAHVFLYFPLLIFTNYNPNRSIVLTWAMCPITKSIDVWFPVRVESMLVDMSLS